MPDRTEINREDMLAFDGSRGGTFKTASQLSDFGSRQNSVNMVLADRVNALIAETQQLREKLRDSDETIAWLRLQLEQLEERERRTGEIMKRLAEEVSSYKKEVDRVRLAEKLNSSAIERLDRIIRK
ncbi:MAG TPA: hypothetical protein DCZ71_08195 [Ruminococcus sp.]|nr:hypothetical protein [Ruminococcus sp.]